MIAQFVYIDSKEQIVLFLQNFVIPLNLNHLIM